MVFWSELDESFRTLMDYRHQKLPALIHNRDIPRPELSNSKVKTVNLLWGAMVVVSGCAFFYSGKLKTKNSYNIVCNFEKCKDNF